jgi:hypothetical protein
MAAASGIPREVEAVFGAYPNALRAKLLRLRKIILDTADKMEAGPITETLKWGQPAYLAKGASTIRIDAVKDMPGRYAMYFICHTDLIARFREHYPDLDYSGNRAIFFNTRDKVPEDALRHCVSLALKYKNKT